jgi:hypothetical protein
LGCNGAGLEGFPSIHGSDGVIATVVYCASFFIGVRLGVFSFFALTLSLCLMTLFVFLHQGLGSAIVHAFEAGLLAYAGYISGLVAVYLAAVIGVAPAAGGSRDRPARHAGALLRRVSIGLIHNKDE